MLRRGGKRVVADLNCQRHQNKSNFSIESIRRAGTVQN